MGIESVARASRYSILYHNTFENHNDEVEAIRSLISFRVSGIIVSPIQLGVDLSHLKHAASLGIPIVSIDKLPNIQCHSISFADKEAATKATSYLVESGHEKIAYIKGPESVASAKERLKGFTQCMAERGLEVRSEWLVDPGTTEAERHTAIYNLLKDKSHRPTAVFCFNDLFAVSVYKAAHELGLSIPKDLSVVGFDDIEIASLLGPPLTTVAMPAYNVGAEAAEMIMTDLKGGGEKLRDIKHTPKLVQRGSVAKNPRSKS